MRILFLDIETAPAKGYFWGTFKQYISPSQIEKGTYVLCWAARWQGEQEMMFDSVHQSSEKDMLERMHKLMNEADAIVHYYGTQFDVKMLNTEFIKHGMLPPSPFKNIDLKKVSSSEFRFPSNKLEYVAKALGIGHKIKEHIVFELWIQCMEGNEKAWRRMEKYNKQDVVLLERLYDKYRPWIKNHPNFGSYNDENRLVCPNCGGTHHQKRGFRVANLRKYQGYQCMGKNCGKWFRSNQAIPSEKVSRFVGV